jgi:hypothetical protein
LLHDGKKHDSGEPACRYFDNFSPSVTTFITRLTQCLDSRIRTGCDPRRDCIEQNKNNVNERLEMEDAEIDRVFPHQVLLPASMYSGGNFRLAIAYCGPSLAPRGHVIMRGREWHYVFCFSERDHAEALRARFGGSWHLPREPKGSATDAA